MLGLDDDEDDEQTPFAPTTSTGTKLKSLFALNEVGKDQGNDTFKWKKEKKTKPKKEEAAALSTQGSQIVDRAGIQLFRPSKKGGPCDEHVGPAMVVLLWEQTVSRLICYDQQKRTLLTLSFGTFTAKLRQQYLYLTAHDGDIWGLCFRDLEGAEAFVQQVHLMTFEIQWAQGQNKMDYEIRHGNGQHEIAVGDQVGIKFKAWVVEVGNAKPPSLGRCFDETPQTEFKKLKLGDGTIMKGMEDGLAGMSKGGKRLLFYSNPEDKSFAGLPHPELAAGVVVVALIEIVKLKPAPREESIVDTSAAPSLADSLRSVESLPVGKVPDFSGIQEPVAPSFADAIEDFPATMMAPPPPPPAPGLQQQQQQAGLQQAMQSAMMMPFGMGGLPGLFDSKPLSSPQTPLSLSVPGDTQAMSELAGKVGRLNERLDKFDLSAQLAVNNVFLVQSFRQVAAQLLADKTKSLAPATDIPAEEGQASSFEETMQELKESRDEAWAQQAACAKLLQQKTDEVSALKAELEHEKESMESRLLFLSERFKEEKLELKMKHTGKIKRMLAAEYERGRKEALASVTEETHETMKAGLGIEVDRLKEELETLRWAQRAEREENKAEVELLHQLISKHEAAREEGNDRERELRERLLGMERGALSRDVFATKLKTVMNGVYFGLEEDLVKAEGGKMGLKNIMQALVRVIKEQTKIALHEEAMAMDEPAPPPPPPPPPLLTTMADPTPPSPPPLPTPTPANPPSIGPDIPMPSLPTPPPQAPTPHDEETMPTSIEGVPPLAEDDWD